MLSLDSAQRTWAIRLREISDLEFAEVRDVDNIISMMNHLDKMIQNAPLKAFRVAEVEHEFYTFTELQDELATYQRSVVPKSEYAQMLIMIEDKVPKLWAAGEWPALEKALDEISEFVNKHEMLVRSELVIQNKRNSYMGDERNKTSILTPKFSSLGTIRQFMPLVRTMVSAIDARDTYMAGHSDLVAHYSVLIAKKLGWADENINELEIAALLHDVGKINIPEAILTKTERLTSQEWRRSACTLITGPRLLNRSKRCRQSSRGFITIRSAGMGGGILTGLPARTSPWRRGSFRRRRRLLR